MFKKSNRTHKPRTYEEVVEHIRQAAKLDRQRRNAEKASKTNFTDLFEEKLQK